MAQAELHDLPDAVPQGSHLFRCDRAQPATQAFLCDCVDLVADRYCALTITGDWDQDWGLALGELDSGTTITVPRLSLI